MKIYLLDYNIDEREPKKIYVSQYSSYKIGINVNGVDNSKIKFAKKSDGKPIAAEEEFKGYNTYSFEASTPGTTSYIIQVPYSNTRIRFTLEVITTDSTVAELSSGGMPTDLKLNSLTVSGTLSADASNVYLKGGNKLDIKTEKNDIITATNQNVDIQCTNLTANGDINCSGTFRGSSVQGNNLNCDSQFSAPGLTCSTEQGTGLVSVAAMADDVRFMGNAISFFSMGNLDFNGVTTLVFNFDNQGNLLKAVPRNITDGSGNSYTVLALIPNS